MCRKPVGEIAHLIGDDMAAGKNEVLEPTGLIRDVQERHTRFFRCATTLPHIAGSVRRDDVGPDVLAATRFRVHMIACQIALQNPVSAVGADHAIALFEQDVVIATKRNGIRVTNRTASCI